VRVQARDRDGIRSHCFSRQDKIGPIDQNSLVLHFLIIFFMLFLAASWKKECW